MVLIKMLLSGNFFFFSLFLKVNNVNNNYVDENEMKL